MKILSLLRAAMFGTTLLVTAGASFAQQPKVLNLAFVGRATAPEGIAMTAFCVGLFVYLLQLPFQLWPLF